MLRPSTPQSNAERQRRFRSRNPGYNRKYNGRPDAAERRRIHRQLCACYAQAEAQVLIVLRSTICKPMPLMLPAPVMTIELPAMTTLGKLNAIPTVARCGSMSPAA